MKLNYKNDYVSLVDDYSDERKFRFVPSYKLKDDSELEDYLNSNKLINSYKKLIKYLKDEKEILNNRIYYVFINDNFLYIFKDRKFNRRMSHELTYVFESEEIKQFFLDALNIKIDSERNGRAYISTIINNYTCIMEPNVLDVFLTSVVLKSRNEIIYNQFKLKCKNGKIRDIVAPHPEIKKSLQRLNSLLQNVYDWKNNEFQVAYKKGKNIVSNAEIHKDKKYVFNIDLHNFFPSCKRELVEKYIRFLFNGCLQEEKMLNKFLDIILLDDGLFIGSPISGCLANTIINKPVAYLKNMTKKINMGFSVYADDMTFSSDEFITKEFVINLFNEAFTTYNLEKYFKLNEKKLVGYTGCNRRVTGISLNGDDKVTVKGKYYKLLRAMICNLAYGDTSINIQQLRGKIAFAVMVDESGKIYRYLKKFEATVKKYHLISEERFNQLAEKFEK